MPEYIYLIHPFREGFFQNPTPEEEEVMEEHFDYLKQATRNGVVVLAGPCLDETFGLVIFQSDNEETAREFMYNDPSIKKNIMLAELHPMHISLRS